MRAVVSVGVALLIAIAVLPGSAGAAGPVVADAGPSSAEAAAGTADQFVSQTPPDPPNDTIGWEGGYWYNESIDVTQADGLSAAERRAVINRTMARVEHIRRLEFNESVPVSIITRTEYQERVQNTSTNATLQTFDNTKFEALLLINETTDSIGTQQQNQGVSTGAFYDIERDEITVIAPNASAVRFEEYILAHELTHALQDQHFNLSRLFPSGTTRDEVSARLGIIEGDAYYVDFIYEERRCNDPDHPWNGTCVRRPPASGSGSGGGGGQLANIGAYVAKKTHIFDGAPFVARIRAQGGWAAVNAVYERPPATTEQVIHPEKYPNELPANVTFADRTTGNWTRVRPAGRPDYASLGQGAIAGMLVYPLYDSRGQTQIVSARDWFNYTGVGQISTFDPVNYGFPAAAGWNGDRMHIYRNAANETAYVWRIAWDSERDADEFLESYRRTLEYWGAERTAENTYVIDEGGFADAFRVTVEGATVTIVNAPTVEDLPAVRPAPTDEQSDGPAETVSATATDGNPDESTDASTPATDSSTTATPTERTRTAVGQSQPGFGAGIALAALLVLVALAARRR